MRTAPVRGRALLLVLLVSLAAGAAAEKVKDLQPQGYVNDFAHVLSARTSSDIYQLCLQMDEKAGAQIAVVTIHTLEGDEAADFGNRLFQKWGVGHKDNRGVLILLAVDDHKYWTEVGYGLEPILNDAKVGDFGRTMVPFLKRADYDDALLLLTQQIAGVIAKDRGIALPPSTMPQPPPRRADSQQGGSWVAPIFFFLILAIIFGPFVAAFLIFLFTGKWPQGRSSGGWTGGGWSGGGFGGFGGGFGGGGGGGGFGGFGGGMSGGGGAGGSW